MIEKTLPLDVQMKLVRAIRNGELKIESQDQF